MPLAGCALLSSCPDPQGTAGPTSPVFTEDLMTFSKASGLGKTLEHLEHHWVDIMGFSHDGQPATNAGSLPTPIAAAGAVEHLKRIHTVRNV